VDFVRYGESSPVSERHVLISAGGVVWTQMSMGSAQALSAAWLTAKMEDHKRPIALAAYVMSIQLANFPGNQLFRAEGMSSLQLLISELRLLTSYRCPQILPWPRHRSLVCLRRCCYHTCLEVVVSTIRSREYGRQGCARHCFELGQKLAWQYIAI
jgi:hypothetical protein